MRFTEADYEHYGKCRLPIKECKLCRQILGNTTNSETNQYDYGKVINNE